jgi:hypothetical protein
VRDEEVVLDGGVAGVEVQGARGSQRVPSRQPERARAADDGHLPDLGHGLVPAEDGDGAAVVLAGLEHEVHGHQERQHVLAGADVGALRAAHEPGAELWAFGERVVDDRHRAEGGHRGVGPRRLRHPHRRRVGTAQHVVPVHPDPRLLLLAVRGVSRRGGAGQEGQEEKEHGFGHGARRTRVTWTGFVLSREAMARTSCYV